MKYTNANEILPEYIIQEIQKYIDGEYIYIPRKNNNQKRWGEISGIRKSLKDRNNEILSRHNEGSTVRDLAQCFYLSEQSIRRIICIERKACQCENLMIPADF